MTHVYTQDIWLHAVYLKAGDRVLVFDHYLVVKAVESDDIETTIHFETPDVPAGENYFKSLTVRNELKVMTYK